jgi:hypothetical protein
MKGWADNNGFSSLGELPQLSRLLFGAKARYRTARATIRKTVDGTLATQAHNRFVDHRRQRLASGQERAFGDPLYEPRYREYQDSEETAHIWHERPDRWRQETYLSNGSGTVYRVADGKGPWWTYKPSGRAVVSPTNYAKDPPRLEFAGLLDPWMLRWELGDETILRVVGQGTAQTGRRTLEVEARTVSLDYPPSGLLFGEGAEDHLLSVDAEIGVILRLAARLERKEFRVTEIEEIVFDEEFPEGIFRLELPGVVFRQVDG